MKRSFEVFEEILKECRENSCPMTIAAAILNTGGRDQLATYECEYGDGEGENLIREFIAQCTDFLRPGETLRPVRIEFTQIQYQNGATLDLPPYEAIE